MIDTLHIASPAYKRIPELTSVRSIHVHKSGQHLTTGYFGGLYVVIFADGRIKLRGSLPTLLWGSNIRTAHYQDVSDGIDLLVDLFGIDPTHCRITRIDLAVTMAMPHPVAEYLQVLGDAPFFRIIPFNGTGQTYVQNNRSLLFYDKAEKAGLEGYLLRFEVQFRGRLERQKIGRLNLADVRRRKTFERLVQSWGHEYGKVNKVRAQILEPVVQPRLLRLQAAQMHMAQSNVLLSALNRIEQWPCTKQQRSRLKKELRALASAGNCAYSEQLIQELDQAIEQAAHTALESARIGT